LLEGLEVKEIAISKCLQHKDLRFEADFWIQRDNRQAKTIKGCEIIDFVQYGTSKELIEEKEGYPILRLNEFNSRFIGIPSKYCKLISKNDFDSLKLWKNDVLICRTNGNPNLVGRSALVAEDTEYAYASYLFKIRPKKDLINSATLVAFLSCKYGRKEIDKYSMTSNQTNFSPAKFREINVPLFSNQVNNEVEKLYYSAFDKLKYSENNYHQAEELLLETIGLKNSKPSTNGTNIKSFKDSFLTTGRLDAEYYQPKYEDYTEQIKNYSCGFGLLQKVCDLKDSNFTPKEATEYKYIELSDIGKSGNITGCTLACGSELPSRARRKVSANDVIISSIEGSLESCALVTEDYNNALCSTGFYVINSESINSETLLVLFKSEVMQNILKQGCSGTILTAINKTEFLQIPVPLIDKGVQSKIASQIEESFSLRRESERLLEEAKEMVEREIERGDNMRSKELDKLLGQLGLIDKDAVIFIDEDYRLNELLHFDTKKKLELIKPDAMYVFNKRPLILFFDLTNTTNVERENDIHKKVWSFDNSPVIFIIKSEEIHVYNALNYVKKDKQLDKILFETEKERNELFSFWNLQSCFTWKQWQEKYIERGEKKKTQKRVNERLFQNIKDVRKRLIELNLPKSYANSLILRLIFIRYLIDRDVEINKDYISGETVNDKRKCFCELITEPKKLNELFKYLNDRFNGVLFKNLSNPITKKQAIFLAGVFSGELQGEDSLFKGLFFEIFDFSIIPVELISGIYESLIDDKIKKMDSAVYTPSFLVDYILNDTVDKHLENSQTSDCKIFEVAVGSGIFLVQSLRRMIEKEIELNGNANKKEFGEKIRSIAKENLFGIDINEEALKVTCFSIYIALLDYQEPKDIKEYEFPDLLNENLFHADFFDTKDEYNRIIADNIKPHYILGNPPWKEDKSEKHLKWLNDEKIYNEKNSNKKIKGKVEIAQSFLLRVKTFMSPHTKVALIVTSTIFYNISSTTKIFRNKFLTTYCLDNFFDLSPVRHLIFEKKDSPASIVYFRLPNNENEYQENIVNHLSVKFNYFLKYFKMLVIEKFDRKEIKQKHFIENDWMFKVALYGNVLDFALLKRIYASQKRIEAFIDNETVFGGAGILEGTPKEYFDFLEDLPINENSNIQKFYTKNSTHCLSYEETYLEAGRKLDLFNASKILFKEQAEDETDIVISYNDSPSVYKKGVFGICSLKEDIIRKLYPYLISDLYSYYIFYRAGSWGTSTRPQIRWKEEYLSFPIIEPNKKTESKLISLVNQFLFLVEEYYKQEVRSESLPEYQKILSKINSIINKLYGITGYEKDLIDYVLNVSRYQFQESKQKLLDFTDGENDPRCRKLVLEKYADVYIQEFEKIYDDEFLQVEIYPLKHFIAMKFKLLKTKPKKQLVYPEDKTEQKIFEIFANNLSISQKTYTTDFLENLFIQKDIKGFEENSFYIIKPNEYKCWHRAMAWYDVAKFKEKIEGAELKWLK